MRNDPNFRNLKPLSDLKGLFFLDCTSTAVTDLTPLKGVKSLEYLGVRGCKVADIKPLRGLVNLKQLDLLNTNVRDISPILQLPQLRVLCALPETRKNFGWLSDDEDSLSYLLEEPSDQSDEGDYDDAMLGDCNGVDEGSEDFSGDEYDDDYEEDTFLEVYVDVVFRRESNISRSG